MALRFPLQVRRAPEFQAAFAAWEKAASTGRGQEATSARQRIKEVRRLEGFFPRKPFTGRNVPKSMIPRRIRDQGVTNLFRNDLPGGWRLLHTVMEVGGEQVVIALAALSHPDYDDLFGYEGR
ncbi:MAG: hypothetical protein HYT80_02455 [Euryarchaeota archaeon]|nr:hypothetical protein [Euryarchaeota archaeon]